MVEVIALISNVTGFYETLTSYVIKYCHVEIMIENILQYAVTISQDYRAVLFVLLYSTFLIDNKLTKSIKLFIVFSVDITYTY